MKMTYEMVWFFWRKKKLLISETMPDETKDKKTDIKHLIVVLRDDSF